MAKYRKKLLTEAHQLSDEDYPTWLSLLFADGKIKLDGTGFIVTTLEGLKTTGLDSWIALDAGGNPYPIDADIFDASYEAATQ